MEIRKMTVLDTDGVLDIIAQFKQEALDKTKVSFDMPTLKKRLNDAVLDDSPIVFVALDKEAVIGVIAGVITPSYFDENKISALELIWFVDKEYRGNSAGLKLLKTFEGYCKARGANTITMIAPNYSEDSKEMGFLYKRLGYKKLETNYLKEV